ncbi:T9SS type A sorting domain-containing protein [Flavobacterium silvaticum]|uniref:T9SS type A sorting domain-containing protein n=1 Tax=Flavobacterium silvaticum TaxID=1852020 RepID=A0A972FLL5_9FLAO|nr:T9SS type A sorting domain-containing protein [Flavobacterium silvaticum]NMH28261.1 T9SS type A sorting domain-containing protein [Flavobacterium silvaticum]
MKKALLFLAMIMTGMSFGQVTIGSGTAVDSNAGLSTPISNWYASSLAQMIYLASEINTSGNLTSIEFKLNGTTALTNSNDMISVWVGHSTKSAYTPTISASGADWVSVADHTQVLANGSLTQTGSTVKFTFSQPFAYNGTDNLVITVDANEPGDDGSGILFLQGASNPAVKCIMIRTDQAADNADPLNPPLNYTGGFAAESVQAKTTRPIITLNFEDLAVSNVTSENKISLYPNPVVNELFIDAPSNVQSAEIYSLSGQKIKAGLLSGNKINTSDLASGTYVLQMKFEDGSAGTKKFSKQ